MKSFSIELKNINCQYSIRNGHRLPHKHDALRQISFRLESGERLGIVGANGAGKSTLLQILTQTLTPTGGTITFHNQPKVSLLSLNPGFYLDNSGRENAILGCIMLGLSRREAESHLEEITHFSELKDWMEMPVRAYSSGMKSRLALAISLSAQPDVLLVDESLFVGDQRFRDKAKAGVRSHMQQLQTTVLVSHDLEAIADMCDRILWLDQGQIRADGPAAQVLANYEAWCTLP